MQVSQYSHKINYNCRPSVIYFLWILACNCNLFYVNTGLKITSNVGTNMSPLHLLGLPTTLINSCVDRNYIPICNTVHLLNDDEKCFHSKKNVAKLRINSLCYIYKITLSILFTPFQMKISMLLIVMEVFLHVRFNLHNQKKSMVRAG